MNATLKERIAEAVAFRFEDSRTDKSLLIALHGEAFFSQLCPTCENAQIEAYIELFRLINPKTMPSPNPPSTKYRFAADKIGVSVSVPSKGWAVTADTLTDEQGDYLLALGGFDSTIVPVEPKVSKK